MEGRTRNILKDRLPRVKKGERIEVKPRLRSQSAQTSDWESLAQSGDASLSLEAEPPS